MTNITEVLRVEFNCAKSQKEFKKLYPYDNLPLENFNQQEVFNEACKIQAKNNASFRFMFSELVLDGPFFVRYQNTNTTFHRA